MKLVPIMLLAVGLEAIGVVFLSRGLKQIGSDAPMSVAIVLQVVREGVLNPNILLGVLLEAIFFGTLLYLLSRSDVSLVWPLTSLGFVLTTLAARFILREEVSLLRWSGVILIVIGAGLITWSEKSKAQPNPLPGAAASLGQQ